MKRLSFAFVDTTEPPRLVHVHADLTASEARQLNNKYQIARKAMGILGDDAVVELMRWVGDAHEHVGTPVQIERPPGKMARAWAKERAPKQALESREVEEE